LKTVNIEDVIPSQVFSFQFVLQYASLSVVRCDDAVVLPGVILSNEVNDALHLSGILRKEIKIAPDRIAFAKKKKTARSEELTSDHQ